MSAALNAPFTGPHPGQDLATPVPAPARTGGALPYRADQMHFRIVFLVTLPIFMLISLARRLLPLRRRSETAIYIARQSILREARAAARTCGSLSLMG